MSERKIEKAAIPTCVGVIIDGNRRWARSKGLPKLEGHRTGYENLHTCVRAARARGIPHLVVYAFSTENWKRTEEEVAYLMRLLVEAAKKGSRAEIIAAARNISTSGEAITEESFRRHFWSAEMPDPDIIIRTGGEKRLSNFLLWQAAYSELFFLDKPWPDFSEADLDIVLAEYAFYRRYFHFATFILVIQNKRISIFIRS